MSHARRCIPSDTHPLLSYARAKTEAQARRAMNEALERRCIDKADLAFSAAAKALEGALAATLPDSDIFAQNVRALLAVADAAGAVKPDALRDFSGWPAALQSAYRRLVDAQIARVDTARMLVTRAEPGYKHYVGALSIEADETIPTACVNHDFLVRYNPGFFAHLSFGQLMFVLLHEAEHVTHRHIPRSFPLLPAFREKDSVAHAALTNIGADLEILARQLRAAREAKALSTHDAPSFAQKFSADIPGTLSSENVDADGHYRFPSPWLISQDLKIPADTHIALTDSFFEKITGELLDALAPTTAEEKLQWQSQVGCGPGDFEPAPNADAAAEHSAREAALRAATKVELEKRRQAGSPGRGLGAGHEEDIVVPLRPTPLSHFISQLAGLSHALRGTHPSWAKPDRYSHVTGVFSPARIRVKEPVLFAFDTSGSIADDELAFALNCIRNYQLTNIFSEVHLCLWNSEAYFWHNLSRPLDLSFVRIQRGGTFLSCVASHLRRHPGLARPTLSVFVTDGEIEDAPEFPSARNIVLCTRRETLARFAKSPCHAIWADIRA